MNIIPLTLTLLSPLFNYARITNGGCITSDFVGDIALNYALNRVLKLEPFYDTYKWQPDYKELSRLPFAFTVGKPISFRWTRIYIRNTLFNVDGGTYLDAIETSGRKLFKNFFKVQGIQPGANFSTYLLSRNDFRLDLPITLRLGTGRECLALLSRTEPDSQNEEIWLNLYTLKHIYNNDRRALEVLRGNYQFVFKLHHYILVQNVNLEQTRTIFEGVFP